MIDTHCHLLPGVDDGPQDLNDALKLAQQAVDQGITHILCTPHYNRHYQNERSSIITQIAQLQKAFDQRGIPLTLFEGQEVRITDQLLTDICEHRILFTDVEDTYLLLELPTREIPWYTEKMLYQLRQAGKIPIIVHPERNHVLQADEDQLETFLNLGCLTQVTAPSIVGIFGKKAQKFGLELIKTKKAHVIASDAHGITKRPCYLQAAYQLIQKQFGETIVSELKQHAKDLVNGDAIH